MAALTAVRNTQSKSLPEFKWYPIADNVKIWKGALVCLNSSGFAVTAADAAGNRVVGVADDTYDNTVTGHAAGALQVKVVSGRLFLVDAASMTQASVGAIAYVTDDHTVTTTLDTNFVKAGLVSEFISATSVWIFIPMGGMSVGVPAAPTATQIATALNASYD